MDTGRYRFRRSRAAAAVFGCSVAFAVLGGFALVRVVRADADAPAPSTAPTSLPDTNPSQGSDDIEALARQLGSDNWRERDTAQERLVNLGDDVEPVLKRFVTETANAEARQRAQSILGTIVERRWTGPTLVTLHRHGASPGQVLDEMFKQAEGKYVTWPPNLFQDGNGAMDVDFSHKPFLAALKEVCGKAGVNARFVYDWEHITFIREESAPMFGPTIVDGPVLVSAEGVDGGSGVRFAQPAAAVRSGSLSLQVLLEPRLHVTNGWIEVLKIEDQDGKSLVLNDARAVPVQMANRLQFASEFSWAARVPLSLPRSSTKLSVFKVNLHLQAHARSERVEIRDVLKAKEITKIVGGRRFTLHEVVPAGNGYQMRLTLYRDNMGDEDWAWFSYPYGRIHLVDAEDRSLMPTGGGGGGGTESVFNMTVQRQGFGQAAAAGEPVALVWQLPVKTREIVVPVSFSDLPLP